MRAQGHHRLLTVGGGLVLVLAVALLGACRATNDREQGRDRAVERLPYRGALLATPRAKPDFTLTDTAGRPFDFRTETEGYLTLLFFGYTHCPDICPLHMANLAAVLRTLPPEVTERIKVVFVTVDPERDTPSVLRTWLDHFDPRFIGLTGSTEAVEAAQRVTGVPVAQREDLGNGQYAMSHAAYVIAYTTDNLAHIAYPSGVQPSDWAHDLPKLVTKGWRDQ
jgi:protein SCO1/2